MTVSNTRITSILSATGTSNTIGSIITTSGNVGIGNATPAYTLDIIGSGLHVGDTSYGGFTLEYSGNNISGCPDFYNLLAKPSYASGGGSGPFIPFITLVNTYPRNRVDVVLAPSGGNVGIGCISPNACLELNSSIQTLPRIILSGQEFFGAGQTSTNGIALLTGVNRLDNRQLWVGDSAALTSNTTNSVIRLAINATLPTIDAIATNGSTPKPLSLGSSAGLVLNGNVGIGTTSPESRLHVNGAITLDGETVSYGPNTDTGSRTQTYITFKPNGTDNDWGYLRQVGGSNQFLMALDIHDDGEEPGFCIRSVKSTDNPDTINERFRVQANGNVGIGTTSPLHTLDVNGSGRFSNLTVTNISTSSLLLTSDLSMDNGRVLTAKNASGTYETFLWPRWTDNVMYLNFGSSGFNIRNQASTTVMFMTSTGNVGIGTTAPSTTLDVSGNISIRGVGSNGYITLIQGGANNTGFIEWRNPDTSRMTYMGYGNSTTFDINVEQGRNLFMYTNAVVRMTISSAGNIGMGTTAPSFTLDVAGTARVTTGITTGGLEITGSGVVDTPNLTVTTAASISSLSISGATRVVNIGHAADTSNYSMEIYAPVSTGLLETSIRFHQEGRYWQQIRAYNAGFKFTQGDSSSLVNIEAGGIIGSTARVTTGITTGMLEITGTGVVDTPNLTVTTGATISSLSVSGVSLLDGGSRIVVQNSQDGGTGRGIYMWTLSDPNWGIYMGQSGATKSLGGGTACTGAGGFAQHAIRIRTANSANQGLIYENNAEACLFSVRGSDGMTYVAGNFGVGNASPSFNLDVTGTARITTGITTGGVNT
jgi:hypothetical protein